MKIFEVKFTMYLKRAFSFKEAHDVMSSNLSKVMLNDSYLKSIHTQNGFKPYTFGVPFSREENSCYDKGSIQYFVLRSLDESFLVKMATELKLHKGLDFLVNAYELKEYTPHYIESLRTLTPCILTLKGERNTKRCMDINTLDIELSIKRIIANLEKKYKQFFNEELHAPQDAINYVEVLNQKSIVLNYKKSSLVGNKFRLGFNSDEVSQKLAIIALTCGVLEKNALGFGFCVRSKV